MSGRAPKRRNDRPRAWLIGIDVGGTFTDAVALGRDGSIRIAKVASTPGDPAAAMLDALTELAAAGVAPERTALLVHGSTIATNAIVQGALPRVVLVTTRGFRDSIAIGTGMRHDVYDLWAKPHTPLVPRDDRLEVDERVGPHGEVIVPISTKELSRLADAVAQRSPASVAVACLFSYVNDAHERRIAAAIRARLRRVPVVRSSEIAREFREFPRTHTTALAAALRPIAGEYLGRAASRARRAGVSAPFLVMLSNGGTAPARRAALIPHALVLSGPAAGVAAAAAAGRRLGINDLISLDMGGTSTDVCLVRRGAPPVVAGQTLDGAPILTPAVDIVSVGAGGGSIASLDPVTGTLRVGPSSAGARPGPAAYGHGGQDPTVTDAHVVVGDLGGATTLAGRLVLDRRLAVAATEGLAGPLERSPDEAAAAVLMLARAHLARAVRRVCVDRGFDPRGAALVALGGAGPLHAASLLRELRLGEIIVPPHPGIGSAAGLLAADLRIDASQTVLRRLDRRRARGIAAWFAGARGRLAERLAEDGIPATRQRFVAHVECRYVGQGYELQVPLGTLTAEAVADLVPAFHTLHQTTYGHAAVDEPVEAVTLRLSGFGELAVPPPRRLASGEPGGVPATAARIGQRSVLLPGRRRRAMVPIWRRDRLRAGDRMAGPCIVEQLDATTLVLPEMDVRVDHLGYLHLRELA